MRKGVLALICTCLLVPSIGFADNNMRDYIAAPPNTLLSLLYYHHITGDDLYANGNKAADIDFTQDLFLLREVYYFNIGSYLANAQMILPFGKASLEVGGVEEDSSGIGDLILLGTFWFVSDDKSKTYFAFSPYFFLPTGDYDDNRGINMGSNRFAFRGEFNFTKGWEVKPGHNLYFEVTTGADFFGDNDDYQGNDTLSQDALFNLESHLSYDLTKDLAISFDYYGHWGGDTEVNDVNQDASINTQTIGGTLTYGFAPGWQLLLQYREDVKIDNGVEAQVVQARVFYATDFGGLFH